MLNTQIFNGVCLRTTKAKGNLIINKDNTWIISHAVQK